MHWIVKTFSELSLSELYAIMVLRQDVFVVEQNCPYLDADGKDQSSYHLMGVDDQEELVAYARLLPQGISYAEYCSIGRVVTARRVRRQGIGIELMKQSIRQCGVYFAHQNIKISAQCYLLPFYETLGFEPIGEAYLEDNIPHHAMVFSH